MRNDSLLRLFVKQISVSMTEAVAFNPPPPPIQELTQFCPVQSHTIDVSPIGILGLCNAKGCRCCLVLDSAAADQSCSEWAPAGLPLILPTLIGWGWGGCWCFAREQSVFYSMTPLKVEPFTDFASEEQPRSSSYPCHLPKGSGGQSARRIWWTASGWSWLQPPTETGTTVALPCSLSPNISECADIKSELRHISGTLFSLL